MALLYPAIWRHYFLKIQYAEERNDGNSVTKIYVYTVVQEIGIDDEPITW